MSGPNETEYITPLRCKACQYTHYVTVDARRWNWYQRGANVAEVWPDPVYDSAYREQMIGLRSGYHVCDMCWDEVTKFDDDDDAESALKHLNQVTSRGDNEKYDADEDTLVSIEQELDSAMGVVTDYLTDGDFGTGMDRIKATDSVRAASAVQNDLLDRIEELGGA